MYSSKTGKDEQAPKNYVPGMGRGASGFMTSQELGPARNVDRTPILPGRGAPPKSSVDPYAKGPSGYIPGLGRGAIGMGAQTTVGRGRALGLTSGPSRGAESGGDDNENKEPEQMGQFNVWSGQEDGLLSMNKKEATDDDLEAENIYAEVEKKMMERYKKRDEQAQKEAEDNAQPKLQQAFADLKRKLSDVSEDEWRAIPEPGNMMKRPRRREDNRFIPVPDSMLDEARKQVSTAYDNVDNTQGGATDLRSVGEARGNVLSLSLKAASDSVGGQTVVDPRGYLTSLGSKRLATDAEVGDIKKTRLLMKSFVTTNPKLPSGWIAAARFEENAGKLSVARTLIIEGCDNCPQSEDIWLEAARLLPPEQAQSALARAVKEIPRSVKLWETAAEMVGDNAAMRKKILRRALEFVPNSVRLWKLAIEAESSEENAKILLSRAVECVPDNVEMWLRLAQLEDYTNARKVLNRARQTLPTEARIWLAAAALEESQEKENVEVMVDRIIEKAVQSLATNGVVIERQEWLKYACEIEDAGHILTCQAIVRKSINIGVEEEDRKHAWIHDAEEAIHSGHIETARAIFAHALTVFPSKKSLWIKASMLEREHGSREQLDTLLKRAVQYCPKAEFLWLVAAKEKWSSGDVAAAREILGEAFSANPDSEHVWLAAAKLEDECQELQRARALLQRARQQCGTARIWMKAAKMERELGNADEELAVLKEGLAKYPKSEKMWMMLGQLHQRQGNTDSARETYAEALKQCRTSVSLWLSASRFEEGLGNVNRARALLEKARVQLPKTPPILLEMVRVERRAGDLKNAKYKLSVAFQECPKDGPLWAEAVDIEPRHGKKTRSRDALKQCGQSVHVLVAVARLLWAERKVDKARTWFQRAVALDKDLGDAWAYYYRFEREHGTEAQQQAVLNDCIKAAPAHGDYWTKVSKDPQYCTVGGCSLAIETVAKKTAAMVPGPLDMSL